MRLNYGGVRRGEATLVAMAAAHRRLGWFHPFVDGNGRVMRLHTHTLLSALGYTGGLWSPLRGFARSVVRRGLLCSDSPQGKVRFGLPLHALRFHFAAVWPEAEADLQGR